MISDLQINLNQIAIYCFRNIADGDYISARTLFRYDLIHQAYWSSLQAIEKYLKAILLFNGKSILKLSHDLNASLELINSIKEIKFSLPKDVLSFIDDINNEGANRYYEYPYGFEKMSLFKLDNSVWHIRKYCSYLKGQINVEGELVDLLPFSLNQIENKNYIDKPYKYKLFGGELENILQDKKSLKREQLVWNNKYYGSKKKRKVILRHVISTYGKPPHFEDKNIFDEIKNYVKFSPTVLEYFNKRHNKQLEPTA